MIRSKPDDDSTAGLVEPVQGRSKLSTRRLLEAAGELIAERGYEQASLAAIGERAGYSRGLVTTRFGTKEGLLTVLMERITSDWVGQKVLPEIEGLLGLDAMLKYLDTVIDQLERDPEALRTLWALSFEAVRPTSPLRERFEPYHESIIATIETFLRTGVEDGSIEPSIDPEAEALLYAATLRGMAYHWLFVGDDKQAIGLFHAFRARIEDDYRPGRPRRPNARRRTKS